MLRVVLRLGLAVVLLAPACTRESHDQRSSMEPVDASISIEDVATYPRPGLSTPRGLAFSPDDELLTFLDSPDASLTRALFAVELEEGKRFQLVDPGHAADTEENLSAEEKLRRERRREMGLGITRYAWAESANRLLVPIQGAVYVQDGAGAPLRKVIESDGAPILDPTLSPDGSRIAYVQDAELHVVPAAGGTPRQLTRGGRGTQKTNGLAEFIAQEEMGRHEGYWWSPDGASIAFVEVDETHIPTYRIVHQGSDELAFEDHRYPFAGADNAKVRLGVVSVRGGKPRWMDLGDAEYLARVHWLPDGGLAAELENREQKELTLARLDPTTGKRTPLVVDSSDTWINLNDDFHPLEAGEGQLKGGFVWSSERSGFRHLYLYDAEGGEVRALTSGPWAVDDLEGVDEEAGLVYFTAAKDGPTERHLYSVPLSGGEPKRLTTLPGMHYVELDHGFERFADFHSALDQAPADTVRSLEDGRELYRIHEPAEYPSLHPPELVTVTTRDGVELDGALYRPDGEGPFPTIVSVYGGPRAQRVANSWWLTADMRAQYLRNLGFLVFKLDNRGASRRGVAFESAIHRDMGNIEIQDQVDGVQWLIDRGLTDPARVGIYGWSYGGYLSALALGRAPDTFAAAVAGASPAHWDGYDTHYTERYMGTPESNPEGYQRSSVMAHIPKQLGQLLLVHGMLDENVHFRHTARIIQALIDNNKDYEVLLYPNERHMPRKKEDRMSMEKRLSEFFQEHLPQKNDASAPVAR